MGYDLKPRNKDLGWFHFGAFSWSWMLFAGVGLVIGTGPAVEPARFSYWMDRKGMCPHYNDGYYVTADEARAMAMAARGLVAVQRFITKEWDTAPEEKRNLWEKENERRGPLGHKLYKTPIRKDFIDKAEAFANWAEHSHGFWIW